MDNFFFNTLAYPATVMNGVLTGWLIFTAIVWGLYYVVKKYNWSEPGGIDGLGYIIFALVAGIYVSELYLYLTYSAYSDHVEPSIASISWIFTKGSPIYTGIDAPARYSFAYGPALFIINGYVMKAFGDSILTSKLGGVLAAIFAAVLAFITYKKLSGTRAAVMATAIMLLIFLDFPVVTFWQRADSYIILFVVLALYASTIANTTATLVVSAVCIGICADLKIHAVIYLIPVVALLYVRFGFTWRIGGLAVAGLIVALLPFAAFENISLHNYIVWLKATARHGLDLTLFIKNVNFIALKITAAALVYFYSFKDMEKFRRYTPAVWAFLTASLAVSVVASKPGAGVHHLLPLIPVLIFLFLIMSAPMGGSHSNRAAAMAVLIAFLTVSALAALKTPIILYAGIKDRASASDIAKDLKGILAAYPSERIEMGYAGDESYALSFYRPLVVFHSNSYSLDAAALMDNKLSGISMPNATISDISGCKIAVWLIPRGVGQPFSMNGYDRNSGGLFDAAFRDAFLRHYELASVTRYFDVWPCKR
ncbi:MAG: hypothetical protein HQL01_08915 [Nitrospirae bacterium]|nr:hypothetical protein [Nitrospirota bacterium]